MPQGENMHVSYRDIIFVQYTLCHYELLSDARPGINMIRLSVCDFVHVCVCVCVCVCAL